MVPDPAVSRIHAWIGPRDGRHVLFDAGSRVGTQVNRDPVKSPRALVDGDEIRVGPTTLTYLDAGALPADVAAIEPPPSPPAADPYDGGIYFDCPCGGPMWVTADLAGAAGRCRYCGQRLVVPHKSGQTARPITPTGDLPAAPTRKPPSLGRAPITAGAPPARMAVAQAATATTTTTEVSPAPAAAAQTEICSICQTPIRPGDERISCPSCSLTFHAQCWQENYGCSAYGCDQVNVLAPPDPSAAQQALAEPPARPVDYERYLNAPPSAGFPWESVLLALSFVAMFLSVLGFGIPSAAILLVALVFLVMGKARRKSVVALAILVAIAGTVAGYGMSMFWWKGVRVWETLLKR
jgi:DNA-directed RNA polymerase subunit RPC12/RpoP